MEEIKEADTPGQDTGADDDGNISGNRLAALFEPATEEAEDARSESEATESEAQTAEVEDSEVVEEVEEENVLSHSEEEAEETEVPKSTQKLLKQIGKLTARAKGAEEKYAEQQKEIEALKATSPEDQAVAGGKTGVPKIDKIETVDELEEMKQKAMDAKRWALQHIGKDYVEDGDKEWDGDEIRDILRKSEDYLMEHIPARQAYLRERDNADTNAREDFPVWRGEEEEGEQMIATIMNNKELMEKSLSQLPNQKYLAGLMYEGMKVVAARKADQGKEPVKKKVATPPPATEEIHAAPKGDTRGSKKERKKLEALGTENVSARQLTAFFND